MKSKIIRQNNLFECWVDELNLFSLAKLYWLGHQYQFSKIHYFSASWWVHILIKRWPNTFSKFRQGVHAWRETIASVGIVELMKDRQSDLKRGRSVLGNFSELAELAQNTFGGNLDSEKIGLFLEQEAAADLEAPVQLINLVSESRAESNASGGENLVLLKGIYCEDSARLYGQKNKIEVATYFNMKEFSFPFYLLLKIIAEIVYNILLILTGNAIKKQNTSSLLKIAVLHSHGADINKRCDYFWYPKSGIDPRQMIVYFKHHAHPPTEKAIEQIESLGIAWANLLPKRFKLKPFLPGSAELNRFPTLGYVKRSVRTLWRCLKSLFACCIKSEKVLFWYWARLTWLLSDTDLFHEFFSFHNVKIHFAAYERGRHMSASNLAITECGGIDLTHLWSNLDFVEHRMGKPHDAYFVWGPYYKRHFFDRSFYRVRHYVYSGYVNDYCFENCKEKAVEHRRKLLQAGANRIVAFCDQEILPWPCRWNDASEELYRHLLNTVIRRHEFALIIKAKHAYHADGKSGLIQKYPRLAGLIEKAVQTSRCLVLSGSSAPAEAAQAADLMIGMGSSSTPALEAALCGVAAITYDPESYTGHPMYAEGRNKAIFNHLEIMAQSLEKWIQHEAQDGFGNYSFVLADMDPFRDGQARVRVGYFIKNCLEQLTLGREKSEAISYAVAVYKNDFGFDKVVNGNWVSENRINAADRNTVVESRSS